jgi:hypothetical protein
MTPPSAAEPPATSTTPAGDPTRLRGTVIEGVESGCIMLVDDTGAVLANLTGYDLHDYPIGSRIEVTGHYTPDLLTYCQQGQPFKVNSVTGL